MSQQSDRYEIAYHTRCLEDAKIEPISSLQCQAQNHHIVLVIPIRHCPSQLPGQVAPCSPSWQEQTLGAMQMPLPQPKEQRAERKDGGEGAGPGNAQHWCVLGRLGSRGWTGTYAGYSAHCPWKGPSQGSSHSQSQRGRRGAPDDVCKKREHTTICRKRARGAPNPSTGLKDPPAPSAGPDKHVREQI